MGRSGDRDQAGDGTRSERDPRVVIVHDFMETYGGAERVTAEMARAFPDAPVYAITGTTGVAHRMGVGDRFHPILRPRPRLLEHYRLLLPFYPLLARAVRLPDADVVLSSSYAFAHRFRTSDDAPRVCYCHSPLRVAWSMTSSYSETWAPSAPSALAFDLLARGLRRSDRAGARGVARYLTQSQFTADQIQRFYGRHADVVGAPVDMDLFRRSSAPPEDWFLLCGRLVEPYKRPSIAIEAFRGLDRRLVVAGDGPALPHLRAIAPPNVEFVGHLGDAELVEAMQRCAAAVFPSRDDFGLIPVEVMACGRPVLAYGDGGALYTVIPGLTGEFFARQTAEALREAVVAFRPQAYDPAEIRRHAEQWDAPRFRQRLVEAVRECASSEPVGEAGARAAVKVVSGRRPR